MTLLKFCSVVGVHGFSSLEAGGALKMIRLESKSSISGVCRNETRVVGRILGSAGEQKRVRIVDPETVPAI